MTQQIFFGFAVALIAIYVTLGLYVWLFKVYPFWERNKQNFDLKFWSLKSTRELKARAFLESFSNDADKPWFYYYVKYQYVPAVILILFVFFTAL